MNTNRKGNDKELMAKRYLESQGFQVHRAIRTYLKLPGGKTIVRSNDVFGCFDLVALSPFEPARFIQVTTKAGLYERRKKIDAKFKTANYSIIFQVWAWHGGRGRMYFAVHEKNLSSKEPSWVRTDTIKAR